MQHEEKHIFHVVFTNEPRLSEHEADRNFNERRLELVAHIERFILTHDRFKDKEIKVTFSHKGVSSLVVIIESVDGKVILKIPLSRTNADGEAQFLKVWEKAGVRVPHIIEAGMLDEHPYVLMEYIDAPILGEEYRYEELIEKGIYLEMGRTLGTMHTPKAEGYGRVVNGKAEYPEFKDFLASEDMKERIKYVEENKLLGDEHGSLAIASESLLEHTNATGSSYCHDDFGASNMFATHPITVFDPNPRFNNGYMDLGRSLLIQISAGIYPKQLIDGYFEGKPYDEKVLYAAILLNAYMKFPYWHRVKKDKHIRKVQEYLIQNKL